MKPVVEGILNLFEKYEIHATWAVVGLLEANSPDELIEKNKGKTISYRHKKYSPFPITAEKYGQIPFEILGAAAELKQISAARNQELASHTYAHFYTLEVGQTEAEFKADLAAMNRLGEALQHPFRSIVFPRNQVNQAYLDLLARAGYAAFRGNQENADWANSTYQAETRKQKIRRVLDAYFKLSATKVFRVNELPVQNGLVNIPASRFLRPHRGNFFLENRKLKRVTNEMTRAALNGTIYHLWWHPHNFTFHPEKSLAQLEKILLHFKQLEKSHAFVSRNMAEIAAYAKT
ncbi:MAG: polysaccharide deacetylase family protein [Bacteroidetes bacterium]|nr:polysaccharide deacetylase family protein [Bacteroidota bacterium]